jgi:hypothetical protein
MSSSIRNCDTFTLNGDSLQRARQALQLAEHQIRVAQGGGYGGHVIDALTLTEDTVGAQAVLLQDALEDDRAEAEERDNAAWFPRYQAA